MVSKGGYGCYVQITLYVQFANNVKLTKADKINLDFGYNYQSTNPSTVSSIIQNGVEGGTLLRISNNSIPENVFLNKNRIRQYQTR